MNMPAENRKLLLGKATRIVFLLAIGLMGVAGCDETDPTGDIILAGTVVDQNGKGIQNVDITFNWGDGMTKTVITDTNGYFTWDYDFWRLDWQPPLRVTVTPAYLGYTFTPPQYDLDAEISHMDINFIAIKNN